MGSQDCGFNGAVTKQDIQSLVLAGEALYMDCVEPGSAGHFF